MTTYEYDDQGRVVRTYERSSWTDEDRALMLAFQQWKDSLCSGCGNPRDQAWHPLQDGWYEVREVGECVACHTQALHRWREDGAKDNPPPPVVFTTLVDTRDHATDPLPPLPEYRPNAITDLTEGGVSL